MGRFQLTAGEDFVPSRRRVGRYAIVVMAAGLLIAVVLGIGTNATSFAAPVGIQQCNNTGSSGGDTITCSVTVTNNFTYNAATPGQPTGLATIVTAFDCTGSAVCPTGGTTTSALPVTQIAQCNTSGLGGASTVTCTATVTNNLTGFPTGAAIDSTVVQCQSPGGVNTLTCVATPSGNNRAGSGGPGGQSVTQCNGSGGAGGTLTCTVTAPPSQSSGLPTTIDECVSSGTTGASTVTCTATITNNFLDSTPPTTVSTSSTTVSGGSTTTTTPAGSTTTVTGSGTGQLGNGTPSTTLASSSTTVTPGRLPLTGSDYLPVVAVGLLATLIGLALILGSRFRASGRRE